MDEVSTHLRRLRLAARLTQAELAKRSGVGQPVLSLYERGRRVPRADLFLRLVEVLGYRAEFLPGAPSGRMSDRLVARVLPDLLGLADALPQRPAGDLVYPRLPG
jgi:transcriptional regulator with XRE-family HTH domain